MIEVQVCPGTLRTGYTSYSPRCVREVFGGSLVPHQLELELPEERRDSYILKLHRRKFTVNEEGQYVLKTTPSDMINADQFAANAHLTMQIASEIFDIPTANSALIFLKDGTPAFLVRRVDINKDGSPCKMESFAQLAGLNAENAGSHYRYQLSYHEISLLIEKYFPAAIVAKEQFFRTVVFNYLFSNGDAHLERFARLDCDHNGDGRLAPATDLVNTALHGDTGDLALLGGLYPGDFEKLSYRNLGYYGYDDFFQFGMKMGIVSFRVKRFLDQLLSSQAEVRDMIGRSFLSGEMKAEYLRLYEDRHARLARSLSGLNKSKTP